MIAGHASHSLRCTKSLPFEDLDPGKTPQNPAEKERVMYSYSEDTLGGRALNWTLIVGAALLFASVTLAGVA